MRLLVVTQYYYPEPFRIHEICEELVRRGNEVTVVTSVPNYPEGNVYVGYQNEDSEQILNGVRVIRCQCRPRKQGAKNLALNYVSFYKNANRVLKSLHCSFDVVYTYQLSPVTSSLPGLNYAKKHNIPSLLYCLDLWPESVISYVSEGNPIFKVVKELSASIYKKATKVAVTSPCFVNYISSLTAIPQQNISFIPQHSKDLGLIEKEGEDECVNFVFLGNIGESQFIDGLMRVVDKIKDRQGYKVHIVGSGSELDNVKALASSLCLDEKVVFHGRQPKEKMPDYYKMADICIVSLRHEGVVGWTIPGKVQEYMSAGKAILGCIDGDTKAVIDEAKCGLCCEAENEEEYAKNMIALIDAGKAELSEYGRNARTYYETHFTLEKHVDEIERELIQLINK